MRPTQPQLSRTHPHTSKGVREMSSSTATVPAPFSRVETGALLGQTMGLVALTSGLFGPRPGRAVAPPVAYYAGADPQAVWEAGGATALFIAGFGAAGYATRRDLSAVARACFWALLALIVFGVVAIFVQIPNAALIYSIVGLLIFAGLTAFDFQRLRQSKD